MKILLTTDIAAMAASPYGLAAMFKVMAATLPNPCRNKDGSPPPAISRKRSRFQRRFFRRMGMHPEKRTPARSRKKLMSWLITVARAAPEIPIPRPKIRIGSSRILRTAPMPTPIMA